MEKNTRKNEKDIQEIVAKNPSLLGELGELKLQERERRYPNGTILDLLFSSANDNNIQYLVEIQLGELNTDHIGRICNYYIMEKKETPNKKNIPVVIAENASKYVDYINELKNIFPSLIVMEMDIEKLKFNIVNISDAIKNINYEKVTREIFEKNNKKNNINIFNRLCDIFNQITTDYKLTYGINNKVTLKGKYTKNFISFRLHQEAVRTIVTINETNYWDSKLNLFGNVKVKSNKGYTLTISDDTLKNTNNVKIIEELFQEAYDNMK